MKAIKMLLTISGVCAAACCVLNAGGLERETLNAADFGLLDMDAAMTAPVPAPVPAPADLSAQPAEADRFFSYLDNMFAVPKASPVGAGADKAVTDVPRTKIGRILYSIKLESIRNAFLYTSLTFKTSRGVSVYLSGHKASNCPDGGDACKDNEKFFLALTTQKGETYFVRAMEVVNYGIFASGSKTVEIDGEKFIVKIHAALSDPGASIIAITSGGRKVFSATAAQLGEVIAKRGVDVKLGRDYKLAYGNELVQREGAADFTDKKLVLLMPFPVVDGAVAYFLLDSAEIAPYGVFFPEMDANHGFRIVNGVLDIFELK